MSRRVNSFSESKPWVDLGLVGLLGTGDLKVMKKIFCITCHQLTSPLTLTVKYLSSFDSNQILIHVDKKSDINDFLFLESSNVVVLNDRVNVSMGAVSQIKATLLLLSKASD